MSTAIKLADQLNGVLEDYFLKLVEEDLDRMEFQPLNGKWSCKEILGHLIDSASNNHQRFVRAPSKDEMIFEGYNQDTWVKNQNYRDRSWLDILNLWHQYNVHLVHVIRNIPEEVLHRKFSNHNLDTVAFKTIPRSKPATLSYFIADYIDHMVYHLKEIFND